MGMIDNSYQQGKELLKYLLDKNEVSMMTSTESNLVKSFLLQCASFHESEIMEILRIFSQDKSKSDKLTSFVKRFLIERQYDRLLDFKQTHVNSFLGLFGEQFKNDCLIEINSNEILKEAIGFFLNIGRLRNDIIHNNLVNFNLDKTLDELYSEHNKATIFIQYLKDKLLS